jgi:CRP-like cAMP-binding protein
MSKPAAAAAAAAAPAAAELPGMVNENVVGDNINEDDDDEVEEKSAQMQRHYLQPSHGSFESKSFSSRSCSSMRVNVTAPPARSASGAQPESKQQYLYKVSTHRTLSSRGDGGGGSSGDVSQFAHRSFSGASASRSGSGSSYDEGDDPDGDPSNYRRWLNVDEEDQAYLSAMRVRARKRWKRAKTMLLGVFVQLRWHGRQQLLFGRKDARHIARAVVDKMKRLRMRRQLLMSANKLSALEGKHAANRSSLSVNAAAGAAATDGTTAATTTSTAGAGATLPQTASAARAEQLEQVRAMSSALAQVDDEKAKLELAAHAWLIFPESKARRYWQTLIFLLLLYSLWFVPPRIAFNEALWDTRSDVPALIVDIIFMVDIVLFFLLPVRTVTGEALYITSHRDIACRYLSGWFLCDVVSTAPLYCIGLAPNVSRAWQLALRTLRWLRMARLTRIGRMMRNMRQTDVYKIFEKRTAFYPTAFRVGRLAFTVVFLAHVASCSWCFIPEFEDYPVESWIARYGGIDEADSASKYSFGLYFFWSTMTTVGLGDIVPRTLTERAFAVLLMALGVLFYAYLTAILASILRKLDEKDASYHNKLTDLVLFIKANRLSADLGDRLKTHFQYAWKTKDGLSVQTLLTEMPGALRISVASHLYRKVIASTVIFQALSSSFVTAILTAVQPIQYQTDEIVATPGDTIERWYVVTSGELQAFLSADSATPLLTFVTGTTYGEIAIFLTKFKWGFALKASSPVNCLAVPRAQLLEILEEFPKCRDTLISIARERRRRMEAVYQVSLQKLKGTRNPKSKLSSFHRHRHRNNAASASKNSSNHQHKKSGGSGGSSGGVGSGAGDSMKRRRPHSSKARMSVFGSLMGTMLPRPASRGAKPCVEMDGLAHNVAAVAAGGSGGGIVGASRLQTFDSADSTTSEDTMVGSSLFTVHAQQTPRNNRASSVSSSGAGATEATLSREFAKMRAFCQHETATLLKRFAALQHIVEQRMPLRLGGGDDGLPPSAIARAAASVVTGVRAAGPTTTAAAGAGAATSSATAAAGLVLQSSSSMIIDESPLPAQVSRQSSSTDSYTLSLRGDVKQEQLPQPQPQPQQPQQPQSAAASATTISISRSGASAVSAVSQDALIMPLRLSTSDDD